MEETSEGMQIPNSNGNSNERRVSYFYDSEIGNYHFGEGTFMYRLAYILMCYLLLYDVNIAVFSLLFTVFSIPFII